MEDEKFYKTKQAVLNHIQTIFEEMEEEQVLSHQEKYALLEDAFESASDADELYVAFEQWYNDHIDELNFEHSLEELWDQALSDLEE
jgi:hypothetical protein